MKCCSLRLASPRSNIKGFIQCSREARWKLPRYPGSKDIRFFCTQHTKGREAEREPISEGTTGDSSRG